MELPSWACLGQCSTVVKHGRRRDADGEEGQSALAAYCDAVTKKVLVAQRLWGMSAANAARRTSAKDDQSDEAHAGRRGVGLKGDLEMGFPHIDQGYKFVNGVELGILKQAVHKQTRQRRAVLQIPKSGVLLCHPNFDGNLAAQVKDRLRTLFMIDHVNILAMHEACEDAKCLYLIYEWPDGGLVLDHLTQFHDEVHEAHLASIVGEMLAALAAANHFNIHHLDWSLVCLFLAHKDSLSPLKLFGVGLAGFFVPLVLTRKTSKSKKHFYVSPELITDKFSAMNHRELHASDVWSVGALLYMLFSGRPPFCSSSVDDVLDRIKHGHWTFGCEFDMASRAAKDIIQSMLHKKWETRPSAVELLKHAFMQARTATQKKEGSICQDALSKLDQFAKETHCKQALARLLADLGLKDSQYAEIEKRFRELDLDGNGVVDMSELWQVAESLPGMDRETIEGIIDKCDRNNNSMIDISEFVSALVLKLENAHERLLAKAFGKLDMNNDARVTKGEVFKVLRQYSDTLEIGEVSAFVNDVDTDADRKIDYTEFKHLFPHVKRQDDELQSRLKNSSETKQEKTKQFRDLQRTAERFLQNLRTSACRLALEYEKLLKPGMMMDNVIADKLRELIEIIKAFAGKAEGAEASKAESGSKERRRGMTGLSLLKQCRENTSHHRGRHHIEVAWDSEGGHMFGSSEDVTKSTSPRASTATNPKSCWADAYVSRGMHVQHLSEKLLKEEVQRRRRQLWLGGGEGIKHVRATIMNRWEELPKRGGDSDSPGDSGSGGSPPTSPHSGQPSSPHSGSPSNDSTPSNSSRAEGPHESVELNVNAAALPTGRRPSVGNARAVPQQPRRPSDVDVESEGDNVPLVRWTKNRRKYQNAKVAMGIAAGPAVKQIGFLTEEEQQRRLHEIAEDLLEHFNLHSEVTNELCSLPKLVRYKCARSWLPPLLLLSTELKVSLDESRVHQHERHTIHRDGVKLCLQTCERIMFSITEFLHWQEDALEAMCSVEDSCPALAASKRFLPHRTGDQDEFARTPRNKTDAENLAPDVGEPVIREPSERLSSDEMTITKTMSMPDGAPTTDASNMDDQPSGFEPSQQEPDLESLQGSVAASSPPRFDRTSIRIRKGKAHNKSSAKLHSHLTQGRREGGHGHKRV